MPRFKITEMQKVETIIDTDKVPDQDLIKEWGAKKWVCVEYSELGFGYGFGDGIEELYIEQWKKELDTDFTIEKLPDDRK